MGKTVTYMMALAVGLVFAMAVGLPSLLTLPAPQAPEPTAQVQPEVHPGTLPSEPTPAPRPGDTTDIVQTAPAAESEAPAAAPNQTILITEAASGSVTAVVNERATVAIQAGQMYDLGPYVRPGENTIRLRWSAPVRADIRVRHSSTAGEVREAGQAFLTPASTQAPGEQTLTFYL